MPSTVCARVGAYFHVDYRPGERSLVRKLDFFILSFCCLSYFLNYLDRSNLANAYVSGMREELGFVGNQLNVINTCFTVGYVLGQVPSNLSLHYVKPRIWFPAMMLLWGGLTMVTGSVRNPQSIMAIRFFQGLAEASTFVGTHYILGAWYTEGELGKRSGLFTSSGLAGTMFGGFLQSAIYRTMDGRHGLAGWRWLFVIDGLLTIPVALYGLLLFPDTPHTTTAFYLSDCEKQLAMARIPPAAEKRSPLSLSFLRKVLTSWYWWGFVGLWVIAGETESFSSNSLLALYMQSHPTNRYGVEQKNNYPAGVAAAGILSTLFWAALTDFLGGKRYLVGYFIGITGIATSVMILVASRDPAGSLSTSVTFGAYYWAGTVYACQATFFAWCNDAMRYEEDVFRAVVLAGMNLGSNAVNSWWSIVFYGAQMAPWFTRGMWAMIASSIALVIWSAALSYVVRRSRAKRAKVGERRIFASASGQAHNGQPARSFVIQPPSPTSPQIGHEPSSVWSIRCDAMSQPFRLAVLECDTPVPAVEQDRGTYGEVFRQLLAKGLVDVGQEWREGAQLSLSKWDVVTAQEFPDADEVDGILLSGSKHCAFGDNAWIRGLVEFVRVFLETAKKPVVGICFGHQIIGRALGARVAKSPGGWEISVDHMEMSDEGRRLLGVASLNLHQMHRDAVLDVPAGLVNLGSSPRCAIQGLYEPARILTFQAHPEFDLFIMKSILKARHDQGVFDDAMFADGTARAEGHHDGVLVATKILEFLLASRA
ncbi:hypothetical protein DCS_06321 [Drechmeria coniospora]|uniref:Major facilitator superfamily (MFS) profile domain-containing protein n=1 Tax=Drechmeria coniospora TaxID=98403 RepID=A0A151GBD0_DRECN|nr:hypothetical protein DCS_06321 [Drechmeria coniospora]KYK54363.1 hypothetical protein DCS_06321 [Drechmeria coniospora]